jgi:hypothetical protein
VTRTFQAPPWRPTIPAVRADGVTRSRNRVVDAAAMHSVYPAN